MSSRTRSAYLNMRFPVLCSVLALVAGSSEAQFGAPIDLVVNEAEGAALADLDGDDRLDVVGTGREGTQWYRNLGDGAFSPPITIATDVVPLCCYLNVAAGDVDGNGSPDVAVTLDNGDIVIYMNDGGTFNGTGLVVGSYDDADNTGGYTPLSLHLQDINGDGDLDLFVAFRNWGVRCYDNAGGSFGPRRTLFTNAVGLNKLVIEDLNGDGFNDLAWSKDNLATDAVSRKLNDGDGTFGPTLDLYAQQNEESNVEAGDLDNDGIMDLAFISATTGQLMILAGNGNGTFATAVVTCSGVGEVYSMNVDDLSHDGLLDVLIARSNGTMLQIYEGQGGLAFSPPDTISLVESGVRSLLTGSLDSDDYPDVICQGDHCSFYRNPAGGDTWQHTILSASLDTFQEPAAADVDQDGDMDLITIQPGTWGALAFHRNNGGIFDRREIIVSGLSDPERVATGDFDGDGYPDLIVATEGDGRFRWYRNMHDGTWSDPLGPLYGQSDVCGLRAGDMDNDGDADVVLCASGNMRYYRSNGDSTFTYVSTPSINMHMYRLLDINDDGWLDITDNLYYNIYRWYRNLGGSAFEAVTEPYAFGYNVSVMLDVDNDGLKDLVAIQDSCYWSHNSGGGALDAPEFLLSLSQHVGIFPRAADMDQDGLEDLVIGHQGGISWYRNPGTGELDTIEHVVFEGALNYMIGLNDWDTERFLQADFDSNGKQDWVWLQKPDGGNIFNHRFVYLLNDPDISLPVLPTQLPAARIAPNPFCSDTRVTLDIPVTGPVFSTLLDATGRMVRRMVSSGQELLIERKDLLAGVYVLCLRDENGPVARLRLVVQ